MAIHKAQKVSSKELKDKLHPLVREWFFHRFKDFSETQLYGVMAIHKRENILISAPTGGTKTLTAFLSIINYLVELAAKKELEEKIYAVYVSPLKALNNDIHLNLKQPLEEIRRIAEKKGIDMDEIRVAIRTGDTSSHEKQKQMRKSPHILITTPESLAIVLNASKFSENLRSVEFVIVDEIHALANKRGVHLMLSIERLHKISTIKPVRIGLSATVSPLDEVARFLVGLEGGEERDCLVADVWLNKKIDINVLKPVGDLIEDGSDMQNNLYNLLDDLISKHKTTLIFTNTRAATERVVHHLKERFPKKYIENIGAHHSSLSKEMRFSIEERLRKGELKVVVSSTSLELGIDIGYIDLVLLLGSPKSVARAMQRFGRSGHKLHETLKGRFIVLDRDDLVECSVMLKNIHERKIDKIQIPKNCLDVLSQHIYGMAIERVWKIEEMFRLIKNNYAYSKFDYNKFLNLLGYLAGEYDLENQNVYGKIWYDLESGEIGKKGKLARVIYMTNIGTIPEESYVSVIISSGKEKGLKVGSIDEPFLERLRKGDVFVLGGQRYEFVHSRGMKAYVRGSVYRPPTIPSWFSEMLPLNFDLAKDIGRFRRLADERMDSKEGKNKIVSFIKEYLYVQENAAESIYKYLNEQKRYLGIPHDKRIILEIYKGEKTYYIFHSIFGRRVNDALSRAIGFLAGKSKKRDIEIGVNDNSFYLAGEGIEIERTLKSLKEFDFREILEESIEKTQILQRRFRHCATRGLMILRNYKGRSKSVGKQQVKSGFLLGSVRKIDKNFPLLEEAKREVMEDVMDLKNALKVLEGIKNNEIEIDKKQTILPSPFALNLIIQGYTDLMKLEDKIEFLKRMHELHMKKINAKL